MSLRLRDTTWTIVFKGLIIVHLMIREGEPTSTLRYLAENPSKMAINSFSDGTSPHFYQYSGYELIVLLSPNTGRQYSPLPQLSGQQSEVFQGHQVRLGSRGEGQAQEAVGRQRIAQRDGVCTEADIGAAEMRGTIRIRSRVEHRG